MIEETIQQKEANLIALEKWKEIYATLEKIGIPLIAEYEDSVDKRDDLFERLSKGERGIKMEWIDAWIVSQVRQKQIYKLRETADAVVKKMEELYPFLKEIK